MAEIYAQALEAHGYTVDRAGIGLGARAVTNPALESGQIDLRARVHRQRPGLVRAGQADRRPDGQHDRAAERAEHQGRRHHRPAVLAGGRTPTPSWSARTRPRNSTSSKMSDTTAVQNQLKWGLATDCKTNPVCAAALKTAYGLSADQRDLPVGLRRADGRRPCWPRPSTSASSARPSPTSLTNKLGRPPGRQGHPAGGQHLAAGPQRLSGLASATSPASRPSSTPSRRRWTRPP